MAAATLLPPPMNQPPDPSSLAARRAAASNLPSFQLPPPPELPPMQRYSSITTSTFPQPISLSAGVLPTPPPNAPGEGLSPVSSSANNSNSSAGSHLGLTPYSPTSFWSSIAQSSPQYGFGTGQATQSILASQNSIYPMRPAFTNSLSSMVRNQAPSSGDGLPLPPPPYELSLPSFPSSGPMSGSGSSANATPSNLSVQQQAVANALAAQQQTPITNSMTHPSPLQLSDLGVRQRGPLTPSYYQAPHPLSAPAHQTSFPTSGTIASPTNHSQGLSTPSSRLSPTSPSLHQRPLSHPASAASSTQNQRQVNYSLPAMSGPVLSNVHAPGGQLSLAGAYPGGLMQSYSNMSHGYGAFSQQQQPAQAPPQNDRPFRCDQCPQSFNRNHDLKRHKRIHLAVKPFPCGHCEKSFSRKDALKVRRPRSSFPPD